MSAVNRHPLLIACVAAMALCHAGASRAIAQERPPLPVATQDVKHQDEADILERFAGVATPRRESRLGFETGGRVASVSADVGDRVEAGQELAALDLTVLDAQIAAAEAGVRRAQAQARLGELTVERQRGLAARGAASEQTRDEAEANAEATQAAVAAAEADLQQLRARRNLAVLNAPYAGVIMERHLDEGAIAASGEAVLDMVETGHVEIRLGLPQDQARTLKVGEVYEFERAQDRARARLRGVTQVVERATQTVAVVFDVIDGDVTPGEVVRLRLTGAIEERGFWTPITALSEGRRGVWTLLAAVPDEDADDGVLQVERRAVEILYIEADRAYVRGAVADGDQIITTGLDRVTPGQRVRLARPDEAAPLSVRVADRSPSGL